MGEPIWTTFHIKTPPGWAKWFGESSDTCEPHDLFDAGVTLEVYLGDRNVDVLADGSLHWTWQGEANYGLSANSIECAIDWCDKHHVPYEAYDETKYEMEGSIVLSDGFTCHTRPHNNGITLSQYEFKSICEKPNSAFAKWVAVVEHFAPANFDLDACSVAHLPVWPPPDPDDALGFDECEAAGVDGTLREVG